MEFLQALYSNPLLFSAVLAGFLASICSGVIGSYVVVKRIVFISGSIAHSVLGGIGLCVWLERTHGISWIIPLYGALITGVLSALIIGWIHLHYREREDTVIAAIWSLGMASGVIFISQTPGFNVELTSFLIGNILWVSPQDLWLLVVLDLVVLGFVITMHKKFLVICFDEEQAKLQGVSVNTYYLLLLSLIAITIVMLIQIVGIILVMTLLTIPAAIGNMFTGRLSLMMMIAIVLCALFSFFGMAASFYLDWPSGATIALVAGACYLFSLWFFDRRRLVINRSPRV
ncbi:MAG: Manganese transport system membrane protein MntB [Chlamydiae bacterium]|nr:Manganese transport system membrane protein MntB [Chlamydiota bacterium]